MNDNGKSRVAGPAFFSWLLLMSTGFDFPTARIHFDKNNFAIPASETALLESNVAWLQTNKGAVLILEGHCDEWGDDFYNLQLGDLRAREVKSYLIGEGIDPERIIMVVSYGKRKPFDARPLKEAWAANRRVEFVLR